MFVLLSGKWMNVPFVLRLDKTVSCDLSQISRHIHMIPKSSEWLCWRASHNQLQLHTAQSLHKRKKKGSCIIVEADHRAESAFVRVRLKVIQSLCSDEPRNQKLSSCGQNLQKKRGTQITQQMMEQWGCSSEWKHQRHAVGSDGHFDLQY